MTAAGDHARICRTPEVIVSEQSNADRWPSPCPMSDDSYVQRSARYTTNIRSELSSACHRPGSSCIVRRNSTPAGSRMTMLPGLTTCVTATTLPDLRTGGIPKPADFDDSADEFFQRGGWDFWEVSVCSTSSALPARRTRRSSNASLFLVMNTMVSPGLPLQAAILRWRRLAPRMASRHIYVNKCRHVPVDL